MHRSPQISFAVALSLVCVGCAPQTTCTGRVVDVHGRPVPYAIVSADSMVYKGGPETEGIYEVGTADKDGRFSFTFPERIQHLSASSPGLKQRGDLRFPLSDNVITIR